MLCPYCKEEIKDGALRCKHCHATLPPWQEGQNAPLADTLGYDASCPFFDFQNLKLLLFSCTGRLNRARYWGAIGLLFAGGLACSMISTPLGLLFWFLSFSSHVIIGIKRLHDLDKSGHWMWFTLVPVFNLYVAVLLMFFPGTTGPNRFGADPLQ
jgi:uncharacterized membrane protein YhaH (DUF805 family)